MKFTKDTGSIGGFAEHSTFRRDLRDACSLCNDIGKLTNYADDIAKSATVTDKMWETAREQRNKVRNRNRRIINARDNVRHVLELVAATTGGTVSQIKHALETRHEPMIMRKFEVKGGDEELMQLENNGVTTSRSNGKWYQHKPVKLDFEVLRATLHEQCGSFYGKKGGA